MRHTPINKCQPNFYDFFLINIPAAIPSIPAIIIIIPVLTKYVLDRGSVVPIYCADIVWNMLDAKLQSILTYANPTNRQQPPKLSSVVPMDFVSMIQRINSTITIAINSPLNQVDINTEYIFI